MINVKRYWVGLGHDLLQQLIEKPGGNLQLVISEHGLVETQEGELILFVELEYLLVAGVHSVG